MNYLENRRTMISVLFIFVIMVSLMCAVQFKYVSAEEGKIIYAEDLHEGDILEVGEVLYFYQDCHVHSSSYDCRTNLDLKYSKDDEDYVPYSKDSYDRHNLSPNTYHTIKTYYEAFGISKDYKAWKLNLSSGYYTLIPTTEVKNNVKIEPNKDNSYTVDKENVFSNNYFLISSLDSNLTKNDGWQKSPRGEYYFSNHSSLSAGKKVTLEYEFEAKKGQYLYLDYRTFIDSYYKEKSYYSNNYSVKLNGESLERVTYNAYTYAPFFTAIKKDGKQILTFEYEVIDDDNSIYGCDYGYIRNVSLLTHLNSGNKLDLDKVKDGDKIVYMDIYNFETTSPISEPFIYESGSVVIDKKDYGCYECNDELIWTNDPKDNCKLNDDIKSQGMCVNNPKTGITKTILIILIVASFAILGVVLYNRRNRFSKI